MGFAPEIDWQASRCLAKLSEGEFLKEAAWVILSSGMREAVIRQIFSDVSAAFMNWISAESITRNRLSCEVQALRAFNHGRKISAIGSMSATVFEIGFDQIVEMIQTRGVEFLGTLDFIGKVTRYHLAKNLGFDVVKPDRHLLRIAQVTNFKTPVDLCQAIAEVTGDRVAVIDLVLWRYATLQPRYTDLFQLED